MNKEQVIEKLTSATGLSDDQCVIVNNILENHFLIGKNNQEKIITDIEAELGTTKEEAEKIYESAMGVIGGGIKDRLKRPFGAQD